MISGRAIIFADGVKPFNSTADKKPMASVGSIIGLAYALTGVGTLIAAIVAAIRSPVISAEEQERAIMRASSWPTAGQAYDGAAIPKRPA